MGKPIGQSGIHIFKIAGASISGWAPFWKGDAGGRQVMPFTSEHENRAALAMLFDPRIPYVQRADVTPSFVEAHRLVYRVATPVVLPYVYASGDGSTAERDYYPDFVGVLANGAPFLAEAGPAGAKSTPQERAKAEAARSEMERRGGSYFLITGMSLSESRFDNYALLRSHFSKPARFDTVAAEIRGLFEGPDPCSVNWLGRRLGRRFDIDLVHAAAWRVMCLAAVNGHLIADLDSHFLTADSEVLLLPRDAPPILPPALPAHLPPADQVGVDDHPPRVIARGTVEAADLTKSQARRVIRDERFLGLVWSGVSLEAAARAVGMSPRQGFRVKARDGVDPVTQEKTHARHLRTTADPIYVETLRGLLRQRRSLKIPAIRESPEMVRAWHRVRDVRGDAQPIPSRWVIARLRKAILSGDAIARQRVEGTRHPERPARAVRRYVLSVPAPGMVCQVDEHQFDILLTLDDVEVASRVWGAVIVCVKTGALLGAVLSPAELVEEDYMRLLKQAIEPKDRLVERVGCEYEWSCFARPGEILSDRGLIFRSARSTTVIVDRLGITQKVAPPWAPSAKGTVEAVFRFMTERFAHRFPATTKNSPARRGLHDPVASAIKARMTFREFEAYFYRAVVDGYMQAYDDLRGGVRAVLWDDAVRSHGVPRYIGSADDLKLLLMRSANRKHPLGRYPVHKNGVSFLGHWYVGHDGLTAALRANRDEVDLYYDRRDITTVYLVAANGLVLGAATTDELGPGPVSVWERDARRKAASGPRSAANERSAAALTKIQVDAARPHTRRAIRAAARRAYRESTFPDQIEEIHLDGIVEERNEHARRTTRELDGVIRLFPDLPGPDYERPSAPRPKIEYLDQGDS